MNCPYCLCEVAEEAAVCKTCTRDLYLLKSMMTKIADYEKQIAEIPNQLAYEQRIFELENMLDEYEQNKVSAKAWHQWLADILIYLVLPLLLLLLAHWLVTVVYDTKMLYLRIISIVLPLPFAYRLFKNHKNKLLPWFVGVAFLAISAVIGMSWITSLVDHTPVMPQNLFEWREVFEYSASITFSFMTGMLLGGVAFAFKQRHRRSVAAAENPYLNAVVTGLGEGRLSPSSIHSIMKTLQEYGATIVALGTTALSIFTGLKGLVGN